MNVQMHSQSCRVAFLRLKNTWKCKVISMKNKLRIFTANVKSVLLYGAETWMRTTVTTTKKMQTFVNTCLRRILDVWWPETISN